MNIPEPIQLLWIILVPLDVLVDNNTALGITIMIWTFGDGIIETFTGK
jgi:hypothetical protein